MPSKTYRTHCKVCGEKITDSTQRTTCLRHRRGWKQREMPICPCGNPSGALRAKYCSAECRKRWGIKAPVRTITHVCIGCGQEFERPWNYPSKLKYCSNACSHRQVKKVRDKFIADLPEGAVVFHSGWEVRFWAVCLRFGLPIRSYDGPDIETSLGIYRPDFIVNGHIVDVKGWLRQESEAKIQEAHSGGFEILIVTRTMLEEMESGHIIALSP